MKKRFLVVLSLCLVLAMLIPQASAQSEITEKINKSEKTSTPEFISGKLTEKSNKKPKEILFQYLNDKKDVFKFAEAAESDFVVLDEFVDDLGFTHLRLQQEYKGTPVYGATFTAHVDSSGVLTAFSGTVAPELDKKLKGEKKVKKKDALSIAEEDLISSLTDAPAYVIEPSAENVIYVKDNESHYALLVTFKYLYPEVADWNYFIDAVTGDILHKFDSSFKVDSTGTGTGVLGDEKILNTDQQGNTFFLQDNTRGDGIFTYDGENVSQNILNRPLRVIMRYLPGTLWSDADNVLNDSYDAAAVDAHYYAGLVYDYYLETFNRDSFDNQGAAIKSTVHFGQNYQNAGWLGEPLNQMMYGDGDGVEWLDFSGSFDVIAHEITHAVTDKTANLIYQDESGAMNEAMSDIFGVLAEYWAGLDPDWLMGEDIYTPGISGDALRSLSDPTALGQPDHYSDYLNTTADHGGVHTNSGIINKAAYLLSEGGNHSGVSVNGVGKDKMGDIFYRSLTQYLTENATFSQLRSAAIQSATDLYGSNSSEVTSVQQAFDAVGIN
ncbi:M4 family metallopeptidase [Chengkuizengella axinellae]|uniref:Neutral metalloproteinase n=1 Tax=Chengkuizengella axinellae TaxID=3064388 RepID=A0ABT9J501_9BACL|nr:M4 family metallopeptidase [Chengkuizengella sp. 2205SS18-9]MDP5276683.1 M4 family metallopeptidase [Chengkuizengella sp. 2205SS18-9]